jgi:hypothetical protein
MDGHPFILADAVRARQFALLGRTVRLFRGYTIHADEKGIRWALKEVDGHGFAVTWLGPGWVFDDYARQRRAENLADRLKAMADADQACHEQHLADAISRLRLAGLAERILWAVHRAVLEARTSVVRLPDYVLRAAVWGRERSLWPTHWRHDLAGILESLTWLHLTDIQGSALSRLGARTALLTHAADLRGTSADTCDDSCQGNGGPAHHHYLLNIGRGFLGVLEQFAQPDHEVGTRTYAFPLGGRRNRVRTLQQVGRTGRLLSVYLPAKLGFPAICDNFSASAQRLLQSIVRETTRATRHGGANFPRPRSFRAT